MSKLLAIYVYEEAYYENTIEIEVIDEEQEESYKKNGYLICKSSKDYADVLLENIDDIIRNLEIKLEIEQLKRIQTSNFYDIVENYSYLQKIKQKAYDFDSGKNNYVNKYRQFVYGETEGYGVFRQELVIFEDFLLITIFNNEFKRIIDKNLLKQFSDLVSDDVKQQEKKRLETKIESLENNIKNRKNDLERVKQNIKVMQKDLSVAKKDLSNLVDNDKGWA